MRLRTISFSAVVLFVFACLSAQDNTANSAVPTLVRFSGIATDASGKPMNGVVGLTFSLYKDGQGGAALWLETQNVQVDANGHYTISLGANMPDGSYLSTCLPPVKLDGLGCRQKGSRSNHACCCWPCLMR